MLITDDNWQTMLMACEASDVIAVDTETSGLDVRNRRDFLMGICLSVGDLSGYLPFRHPGRNLDRSVLDHLVGILQRKDLIWHNRKFDMHSLKTIGVDPLTFKGEQYDTMLAAHLVNEEWYSKELDALAKLLLNEDKYKKDEINKWGDIFGRENLPADMIAEYGAQDATLTYRLKQVLWPRLIKQELHEDVWRVEREFTRLLFKMEDRGVGVNTDFCDDKVRKGSARLDAIAAELQFNPGSSNALGEYLLDELGLPVLAHTDTCVKCKADYPIETHDWNASFNKKVMEEYDEILQASNNPAAKLIGEYRGWQKAVSSLYRPMLEKVGPDGLIRTEFKQHGTVTGRLSAANPNLQQVPRGSNKEWNGNAKSAFHAGRDGFRLYGWDYSQLELRLAASYGGEALLLNEFNGSEKADPFSVLAPRIFGYLTEETRHDTKTFVYANLYGAGLRKIAAQLNRPVGEVEALYANYQNSIPGIMDVSKRVEKLIKDRKFVRYWDGRRRHIRNSSDAYKGWNSVCQGGGAQLVKRAMLRCEEFEDPNEFQMVLQVHDEITSVVAEEHLDKYDRLVKHAMTDWPQMGVKLHVEGKEWK